MSRRQRVGAMRDYVQIDWDCAACERRTGRRHRVGFIVRQHGEDLLSEGLQRVDGPQGETKVSAICRACRSAGERFSPQLRWSRVVEVLDALENSGEHRTSISPN